MKTSLIFVTGFFGAPITETARTLAEKKGFSFVSLDGEIEKADGRSVRRICMMMGEHEYRNKEYEALRRMTEARREPEAGTSPGIVAACGDGVLLDDMSRELIEKHTLVIAGSGMTCEALWENAKKTENSCHAFMYFGTEEERRAAFEELYMRQRALFSRFTDG